MDISELIFNETLGSITIGKSSEALYKLEMITEQDGNIPSINHLYFEKMFFEIITLDEIILGIQFDFSYDDNQEVFIKISSSKFSLNNQVRSENLINFLTVNNIDFQFFESGTEAISVKIHTNSIFYFDDHSLLFKISVFEKNYIMKLQKPIRNKF